jgi:hypothetical protein
VGWPIIVHRRIGHRKQIHIDRKTRAIERIGRYKAKFNIEYGGGVKINMCLPNSLNYILII